MKIALIGRPNVGKSTLFNRLVGKGKVAIVGNIPGITRDRKYAKSDFFGLDLQLVDTPGVDLFSKDSLATGMNSQSLEAVKESDVVLFVVDAIEGVTEYDKSIASWLRSSLKYSKKGRSVVLVINKCDGKNFMTYDFYSLGFGEGVAISAEHNTGIGDLYEALCGFTTTNDKIGQKNEEKADFSIKIAIVGRPNVGKSTLINAILAEDRLLTGPQAGVTRDSIVIDDYTFRGRLFSIIDTAGQRKRSKITEKIETIAVLDAWRHIKQAHVVVVLMDINNPLGNQDIVIARKTFDEGKIPIFALNKSDSVDDPEKRLKDLESRVGREFSQLSTIRCLLVSAREKKGLARIFNVAVELLDKWSVHIPTGHLNRWFAATISKNPPPLVNGMPIKLKYISQTNTRPPTFVIFANRVERLPKSYERYLLNQLCRSFNLTGVPLRIFVRQRENPLAKNR